MSETVLQVIISGIVSIIVAFLIALPGLKAFRNQQKKDVSESTKNEAEASKIYSDMAAEAVKREMERSGEFSMLQKRLTTLERNFCEVIDILSDWGEGLRILIEQLESASISPDWTPSLDDLEKIKEFKKHR
jgi:mannitol-specific phosphotransferase system IIBC component